MQKFSYLKSINADYIDELFGRYLQDPDSIDPSWRYFFEGLELGEATEVEPNGHAQGNGYGNGQAGAAVQAGAIAGGATAFDLNAEAKVAELIGAYRELGRLIADIDPLNPPPSSHPLLELSRFGLSQGDLGKTFLAGRLIGLGAVALSEIIARLKQTYCRTIAVEYTHIEDVTERDWLQKRMEASQNSENLDGDTRKFILRRLTESEGFERFLHTRYVAQKRFSVEGGESVIPALDCIIETGADLGTQEFVVGMAHRGRLNVLTNIFGKKPEYIFTEFEGTYKVDTSIGEGDVKYHMGYSADFTTRHKKPVHLSLGSNPSHLEFINPVVEGMCRAKQFGRGADGKTQVMPVLIHGDAAFAGQGVCYETLNLARLEGYGTGGTLHIVINNQIGFTTSPRDSRSTTYCTDVAKMLDVPIFHVNGDDPEAVWYLAKLCTEYRQKFGKDAFIDLICYRKHGHNEGDEPAFTQPLLYKQIKAHASTRERYAAKLTQAGVLGENDAQGMVDAFTQKLTEAQAKTKAEAPHPEVSVFEGPKWKGFRRAQGEDLHKTIATAVPEAKLREISDQINRIPAGFHLHPKLARFFEARFKAIQDGKGIDWGNGEALAYASLVAEGHTVRLSGQDAERGTFSHRHSVLNDFETGERYSPFNRVATGKARYCVYNSHLSETGVMGFEYGYALADPSALVIWEAQFGDFANGAQVIIDQFLSTSESKWQRMSGLVLLLPHGFEGQGPEHSSARLERYLQLCGKGNMAVANLTTPAQLFHAMRRQILRDFRKPLVIMSPKSLLRHPQAVSNLEDFSKGSFQEVLPDAELTAAELAKATRVLLCTGKVYYDLLAERAAKKRNDVAIIRIEQLYPWPGAKLATLLGACPQAKSLVWVQEEPRNMGAWSYVFNMWAGGFDRFQDRAGGRAISYVGREICASPAVGSAKIHEKEQRALVEKAFEQ